MGFRTVVMLNNDLEGVWSRDPQLGQKITESRHLVNRDPQQHLGNHHLASYGQVVECVHADVRTLAVLEHYSSYTPLAHTHWASKESQNPIDVQLQIIREAAAKFGYNLSRKRQK